jgi:hypothetical protein
VGGLVLIKGRTKMPTAAFFPALQQPAKRLPNETAPDSTPKEGNRLYNAVCLATQNWKFWTKPLPENDLVLTNARLPLFRLFTSWGQSVVLEAHHEEDLRSSANHPRRRMRLHEKNSRHNKPDAEQRNCGPGIYVDCERQPLHIRLRHILGHDPQNHHVHVCGTAHCPNHFYRYRM